MENIIINNYIIRDKNVTFQPYLKESSQDMFTDTSEKQNRTIWARNAQFPLRNWSGELIEVENIFDLV